MHYRGQPNRRTHLRQLVGLYGIEIEDGFAPMHILSMMQLSSRFAPLINSILHNSIRLSLRRAIHQISHRYMKFEENWKFKIFNVQFLFIYSKIQVRKRGDDKKFLATVDCIGPDCDLALLRVRALTMCVACQNFGAWWFCIVSRFRVSCWVLSINYLN